LTVRFWNWFGTALFVLPLIIGIADAVPVAKKTLAVKNKDIEASIQYPQTGNKAIDGVITRYVWDTMTAFKGDTKGKEASESAYTLDVSYKVERNDEKMFGVVFTEYTDTGGAHPNSNIVTLNFLQPDGAQVFLPEIVNGQRGIDRVSALARADLLKRIGTGPDAASDPDTITSGAAPLAGNFAAFIWLPDRLHIYFPAYQVASYAAGPQESFIRLGALKDVIRSDWRAPQASFDCRKAASSIEHAVCADASLARLDRQVAEAYQAKLKNAYEDKEKGTVRQAQRDWLGLRDKTCGVAAACLAKAYHDRLATLTAQ
jgi:uncharacterized protein YecT (DUF1311 family)